MEISTTPGIAGSSPSVGLNGQTAPTSSTEVAGINPGGNLQPISVDSAGNQNVNVLNAAVSNTYTFTAPSQSSTALLTGGQSTVSAVIDGAWTGLVEFQGSVDGSTDWILLPLFDYATRTSQLFMSTPGAAATAQCGGFKAVRLLTVAGNFTGTGTATIAVNNGNAPNTVTSADPAGFYATVNLRDGSGSAVNKGASTSAGSLPVVLASDQPALPLSTGAATSALQTTGNLSLATIATNSGAQATSALQTAGNASLSTLATNLPAKGSAVMAASLPVTIASDQAAVQTKGSSLFVTNSISALNGDLLPATDVSVYNSVSLTVTGTFSGSFAIQGSNDATFSTFTSYNMTVPSGTTAAAVQSSTTGGTWISAVSTKYIRIRVISYTSGTVVGNTSLSEANGPIGTLTPVSVSGTVAVTQSGTWTVQPGNTANTTPWLVTSVAGTSGNSPGTAAATTTASTITAPTNALGYVLMATSDNTVNLRYRIGGTATASSGQRLEPGRDTGYIPCGANISIIAEATGTSNYDIQWVVK